MFNTRALRLLFVLTWCTYTFLYFVTKIIARFTYTFSLYRKNVCAYYLHTFVITFRLFFALTTNLQHLFSLQLLTVRDVTSTVFRLQFLRKNCANLSSHGLKLNVFSKQCFPSYLHQRGHFLTFHSLTTIPCTPQQYRHKCNEI